MIKQDYLLKSKPLIELALKEDIGEGDITTEAVISQNSICSAQLIAKSDGILSGIDIFSHVFEINNLKGIDWINRFEDGATLKAGTVIGEFNGEIKTILSRERTALNFLQRMSGIATKTNLFVQKLKGTNCKLLDTRKTLPGFRFLDKYAVKIGGGKNHRFGLYDMVMIKDNHIKAAGSISAAIKSVRQKYGNKFTIEVETKNLPEVEEALTLNPDIIMLDNMKADEMKEAVHIIDGKAKTEASGNVTLSNLDQIASTGVDFISTGAITHSIEAFDISLLITEG